MTTVLAIDGNSLSLNDVVRVARQHAAVRLDDAARTRMQRVRDVVDRKLASGQAVYGVNTGFGKLSEMAIPPDRLAELQVNLVRSHAAGVGPLLPEEEVRAMMLLRANVLAKGHSGVRPELAELLLAMLNAGLYPPVPEQGSVGASGDLAPLSHLALSMIGEGELRTGSRSGPATTLLAERGLTPGRTRSEGRRCAGEWHTGAHGRRRAGAGRRARVVGHRPCRGRRFARRADGNPGCL
jgi:histidine ammonia-lyase